MSVSSSYLIILVPVRPLDDYMAGAQDEVLLPSDSYCGLPLSAIGVSKVPSSILSTQSDRCLSLVLDSLDS